MHTNTNKRGKVERTSDSSLLFPVEKVVVYDIETTGVSTQTDEIIQIAGILFENGQQTSFNEYVKPSIPISAGAQAIHNISLEKVKSCPTFKQLADRLFKIFDKAMVVTFNGNSFDNKILLRQFGELNLKPAIEEYDVYKVFVKHSTRKLIDAFKFYCPDEYNQKKDSLELHNALEDVGITWSIFNKQMEIEKAKPIEVMQKYTESKPELLIAKGDDLYLNFGKHSGSKVTDVDNGYLWWVVHKSDMPAEVKKQLAGFVKPYKR